MNRICKNKFYIDNWNSNYKILKCFILIVFSYNCSGQVGVRNAFDNRDIYSLNFYSNSNESNSDDSIINGNPYLTPLIDGFRYNAYKDEIVNAEGEAINIDKVTLGDNIFVKKDFYPIWKNWVCQRNFLKTLNKFVLSRNVRLAVAICVRKVRLREKSMRHCHLFGI